MKSTGLSPKTLRNHLGLLVRSETVSVTPRLGALADSGELIYHLAVYGGISLSGLRRVIGDAVLIRQAKNPPMKYLLCRGNDLGEVTTKIQIIGKLPGVESAFITLNREMLFATDFMHSLVRDRIQQSETARRPMP